MSCAVKVPSLYVLFIGIGIGIFYFSNLYMYTIGEKQ